MAIIARRSGLRGRINCNRQKVKRLEAGKDGGLLFDSVMTEMGN